MHSSPFLWDPTLLTIPEFLKVQDNSLFRVPTNHEASCMQWCNGRDTMVDCKHSKRNRKQQERTGPEQEGSGRETLTPMCFLPGTKHVMMLWWAQTNLGSPHSMALAFAAHTTSLLIWPFFYLQFFILLRFPNSGVSLGFNLKASCVTFSRTFCRDPTTTTHTTHCLFLDTQKNTALEST